MAVEYDLERMPHPRTVAVIGDAKVVDTAWGATARDRATAR